MDRQHTAAIFPKSCRVFEQLGLEWRIGIADCGQCLIIGVVFGAGNAGRPSEGVEILSGLDHLGSCCCQLRVEGKRLIGSELVLSHRPVERGRLEFRPFLATVISSALEEREMSILVLEHESTHHCPRTLSGAIQLQWTASTC